MRRRAGPGAGEDLGMDAAAAGAVDGPEGRVEEAFDRRRHTAWRSASAAAL